MMSDFLEAKGFLHQTEEGTWLLCDAPNLKSCCLEKHLITSLEGDFSHFSTTKPLIITEAGPIQKNGSVPYGAIGAAFVLLALFFYLRRRLKRPLLP